MNWLEKRIDWIVVFAVSFITTMNIFTQSLCIYLPVSAHIIRMTNIMLLLLLLIYQKKHFGVRFFKTYFALFFVVYCLYIVCSITIFRKYPLTHLLGLPGNMASFSLQMVMMFCYLMSAETILKNFDFKKFLFLSLLLCVLPTLLYIHIVGVNFFQEEEWMEERKYIHPLVLSYMNVPILVIGILFHERILRSNMLNIILLVVIILSVGYILIVCTKRGPVLWAVVSILITTYLKSRNGFKYFFLVILMSVFVYYNFEVIMSWLDSFASGSAARISKALFEHDTASRFDLNDKNNSNYILGFNQFLTAPLFGSYFRLITNDLMFRGVYPHNLFIEVLMTMGIVGFIPFMFFTIKAFINIFHQFRVMNDNHRCIVVLFLAVFLQLLTTGTIVLNISFWLFFYILYNYRRINLYICKQRY